MFDFSIGLPFSKQITRLLSSYKLPNSFFISCCLFFHSFNIKATVRGDTGHKSAEMITKRYAHILDEDRKVNATKFEDEFYASKENEEKDDASELLDILKNNDALREQLKKMLSL